MVKILKYKIVTAMGKVSSFGDKLDFLTEKEAKELDVIGYTGKNSNGTKVSREKFLNALDKGTFDVEQTKRDNGDFSEEFLITRVITKESENKELRPFRVHATVSTMSYVDVMATDREHAMLIAEDLDSDDFITTDEGDFNIVEAEENNSKKE